MQTNRISIWGIRLATFALAALAAASAAYWGLKAWGVSASARSGMVAIASAPPLDPQALASVLGGGAAALRPQDSAVPVASSRYVLLGVVADRDSGGAALIAVNGNPAKPVRVGGAVDGRLFLQSVEGRRAVLSSERDGPPEMALELPVPGK